MIRQAWGFAPNPSRTRARFRATAKPLHLNLKKTNGFPKAVGLWRVQGRALALAFSIGQSLEGFVLLAEHAAFSTAVHRSGAGAIGYREWTALGPRRDDERGSQFNWKDHGPENMGLLCRMALNLARLEGSKGSTEESSSEPGGTMSSWPVSWGNSRKLICDSPGPVGGAQPAAKCRSNISPWLRPRIIEVTALPEEDSALALTTAWSRLRAPSWR